MKFFYTRNFLFTFLLVSFLACKKDISPTDNGLNHVPDFETRVSTSVSGFVTSDNGLPVEGALVTAGSVTATTNEYGHFSINNVLLRKEVSVVRVKHPGYFNGIRSFMAEEGKSTFIRVQLLSKTQAGSVDATGGGSVSLTSGMAVSLPAAAVTLNGAAYTGQVNVYAKWIDPTSPSLAEQMPGDLRAVNTEGYMRLLETYGMVAVELETPGGEKLEVAAGKKATVTFPLPATLMATAPNTIPLWHFNEETGLWVEEGSAGKVGNAYVGEVSHFSFWNCDIPMDYVQFSVTLLNPDGSPLAFTTVELSAVNDPNMRAYGRTNEHGYVTGAVPANRQLTMKLLTTIFCSYPVQIINTGNTNVNLGNVTAAGPSAMATVSGTVTDCNGQPLQSGSIMIRHNGYYSIFPVVNGAYNFSIVNCDIPIDAVLVAITDSTQSDSLNITLVTGNNTPGVLDACVSNLLLYDGVFNLRGIHNRPGYQYPYETEMHLITIDTNTVFFYWPLVGSAGHPIAVDSTGTLSWYGPTVAPKITFQPGTHTITDVTNTSAQGPPISLYSGPLTTHNYYDPATKTIYVAWMYNNNPDRAFFDTLTYIGPR